MNLKKTALLALILAIAALYVFKVMLPKEEALKKEGILFGGVTQSDLTSIGIKNALQEFTIKRKVLAPADTSPAPKKDSPAPDNSTLASQDWELSALPGAKLDPAALSSLLAAVTGIALDTAIAKNEIEGDLSVYGLAKAENVVTVTHNGTATTIELGKHSDYLRKRYARISGKDALFLIADNLYSAALKSSDDYRLKTPIDFIDSAVDTISVTRTGEPFTVKAQDSFNWKIVAPAELKASDAAIAGLTKELRNLRASSLIDSPPAQISDQSSAAKISTAKLDPYGLNSPAVLISIGFKEHTKRKSLEIRLSQLSTQKDGKRESTSYFSLTDDPSIYVVAAKDILPPFLKPIKDFREKRQFAFVATSATKAVFEMLTTPSSVSLDNKLTLENMSGSWSVNGKKADQPFAEGVIRTLADLTALDFPLPQKTYGFEKPRYRVTLTTASKKAEQVTTEEHVLIVGAEAPKVGNSKSYYATTGSPPGEIFQIGEADFKRISPREETLVMLEQPTPAASATPTTLTP